MGGVVCAQSAEVFQMNLNEGNIYIFFKIFLFVCNSVNLLDKILSLILKQNKMLLFSFSCPDIFIMICDHLH